jgi:phosphatidylglycerophosphate synthase
MAKVTLQEVRNRCAEGRFFSYEGLNDRVWAPISVFFVWVFVRLGWSGNAVSILSGLIAMSGGVMMASNDSLIVFLGSFGYVIFFLLDYVDGGVARFNGKSGIGGQYVDWAMHVVSAVGYFSGIMAGAILTTGIWIVPFGVLTLVAVALAIDRYALGWFTIAMHNQQQRVKGTSNHPLPVNYQPNKPSFFYRTCRNFSTVIFHESYAIYLLPVMSFAQIFISIPGFDFRMGIMLAGGIIYFPVILYDLWSLAAKGYIDNAYNKMYHSNNIPDLPNDHFFG